MWIIPGVLKGIKDAGFSVETRLYYLTNQQYVSATVL
jgi:hypothetical protein